MRKACSLTLGGRKEGAWKSDSRMWEKPQTVDKSSTDKEVLPFSNPLSKAISIT